MTGNFVFFVVLSAGLAVVCALLLKAFWAAKKNLKKYQPIIDIESEVSRLEKEAEKLKKTETNLLLKSRNIRDEIGTLQKELKSLEDESEIQSFGLYEPKYDFESSDHYKAELDHIRKQQKQMIKDKSAAVCYTPWLVEDSRRKGQTMTNEQLKLMLRAFNGECDSLIMKVKYNNINSVEQRSENDSFFVDNPKMPSGAAWGGFLVSPSDGLLKVYFVWDVKTNRYGDELREKYEELRDILKKKYRRGEEYDFLRSDSIWDEPGDYVKALAEGERFLRAFIQRATEMADLLQQVVSEIQKLPQDQRDAIAARILTDLRDDQAWTERFEATTDEQWDRLAEGARREIAAGDTVPLNKNHEAFGMWRDRKDMADVNAYVRNLRKSRLNNF